MASGRFEPHNAVFCVESEAVKRRAGGRQKLTCVDEHGYLEETSRECDKIDLGLAPPPPPPNLQPQELESVSDWPIYKRVAESGSPQSMPWSSSGSTVRGIRSPPPIQNLERFYETVGAPLSPMTEEAQRSQINHSRRVPDWLLGIILAILGIGGKTRRAIGSFFYVITVLFALGFTASGATFIFLEARSEFSKAGIVTSMCRGTMGGCWVGLGVYSRSLSRRLFSNPRLSSWVRVHAKSFIGVNIMLILTVVIVSEVTINLYWDSSVLETYHDNSTVLLKSNCPSVGASPILCQAYYGFKILYSITCVIWNILVAAICLSVCRTHTIGIRRFQKELLTDARLYEEFCKIQALYNDDQTGAQADDDESWDHVLDEWEDDSSEPGLPDELGPVRNSALLETFTQIRQEGKVRRHSDRRSMLSGGRRRTTSSSKMRSYSNQDTPLSGQNIVAAPCYETEEPHQGEEHDNYKTAKPVAEMNSPDRDLERGVSATEGQLLPSERSQGSDSESLHGSVDSVFAVDEPPLMTNASLHFTFFQLGRRLSITSRLLQRWVATWTAFTMIWSCLLIFYWMSNAFEVVGMLQFLGPLAGLALVATAYAEVNFEGDRLEGCVMPRDERVPFLFYVKNSPLQMKVYGMALDHKFITTVLAGVVLTFATRIILKRLEEA